MLTSNGSTWASTAPAPSGGTITAVASGSLADGSKVVLNSDGTVSAVSATFTSALSDTLVTGTSTQTNIIANQSCGGYDPVENAVVFMWRGTSNYAYAIAGTISGSTITFGTAVVLSTYPTGSSQDATVGYRWVYCSVQKCHLLAYSVDFAGYSPCTEFRTFKVSGNSITSVTYCGIIYPTESSLSLAYDSIQGRVWLSYYSSHYAAILGSVGNFNSGITCSFSSPQYIDTSGYNGHAQAAFISAVGKIAFVYTGDGNYGTVRTVTITGPNVFSMGEPVQLLSYTDRPFGIGEYCTDGKVILCNQSSTGYTFVGTISGTSISFGAGVANGFSSGYSPISVISSPGAATYIGMYGYICRVVVAGSTPSFPYSMSAFGSGTYMNYSVAASEGLVAVGAINPTISAYTASPWVSNASGFIGISNGAYTSGQQATIQVIGAVDDAQSGLTVGKKQYITYTGLLTSAAPTQPYAGLALSSTRLLIKG